MKMKLPFQRYGKSAVKASGKREDFPLRVNDRYVDVLNSVPEFRDLATDQLLRLVPKRYQKFLPNAGVDELQTRAAAIGMLATEEQIEQHTSTMFVERSVSFEVIERL
jgi:hypothetical protein